MIDFEVQGQFVIGWVVVEDFVRCSSNKDQELNELNLQQRTLILHSIDAAHQTLYKGLTDSIVLVNEASRLEKNQCLRYRNKVLFATKMIK